MNYKHTVQSVDIPQFMGTWYVWAGRMTYFERGAFGAQETYTWNPKEKRIDIDFSFHKDSFKGELKKIPQKAWIENQTTHAHWKVQPFWPLKFDYLIIDLDPKYQWTAVGVPSGAYLWIMGRVPKVTDKQINLVIDRVKNLGYPTQNMTQVPQKG